MSDSEGAISEGEVAPPEEAGASGEHPPVRSDESTNNTLGEARITV